MQKVHEHRDNAKQMAIENAIAIYVVDNGFNPKSLEDLVKYGLLKPEDILDQNGNFLSFNPTEMLITKRCGACRGEVSSASIVGDICPHCGVCWGYETKSYSYHDTE